MSLARSRWWAPVVLLLCAGSALAQEFSVRSFIAPESGVTENDQLRFVIQISGTTSPSVRPQQLVGLENLSVISGPHTKHQTSWVNGKLSASQELSWLLLAEGPGPARIPAQAVNVGSTTYQTASIGLNVGRRAVTKSDPGAVHRSSRNPAEEIFLELELDPQDVWVGQPVSLSINLYTLAGVSRYSWQRVPDFADFWVEKIEVRPEAEAFQRRIGGRLYTVYPLERRSLVPPSPGEFTIEPFVAQLDIRASGDQLRGWFGFGRTRSIVRKTEPGTLVVKSLPPSGRPETFGGAVGRFELRAELDRAESRVDDAVALRVTVEGDGALRAIEPPVLEESPDLKVYDPQVKESTLGVVDGEIVSRKVWEWIVVPLVPGEIELPRIEFAFFDPSRSSYRTLAADPLGLIVDRGKPGGEVISRSEVRLQRRELAFIKPLRGRLRQGQPRAHRSSWFRALVVLPLLLTPLVVVFGRHRARLERDQGLARSRRARSRARRRLQQVRSQLDQVDSEAFHGEVARGLVEYVADHTNRSSSGLTYEIADGLLASQGIDAELRQRFRATLEACDFARFVPDASKSNRRTELLDDASGLIEELERCW